MTMKEFVKNAGLFSAMLICMIVAGASNTCVGTAVSDSFAAKLRGGVVHNDSFHSDPDAYCEGGVCNKNMNAYGGIGTSYHAEAVCGPLASCETYTDESGCNEE